MTRKETSKVVVSCQKLPLYMDSARTSCRIFKSSLHSVRSLPGSQRKVCRKFVLPLPFHFHVSLLLCSFIIHKILSSSLNLRIGRTLMHFVVPIFLLFSHHWKFEATWSPCESQNWRLNADRKNSRIYSKTKFKICII